MFLGVGDRLSIILFDKVKSLLRGLLGGAIGPSVPREVLFIDAASTHYLTGRSPLGVRAK